MNRDGTRTRVRAQKNSDANFEIHFRRMIGPVRAEAHKRERFGFATRCGNRVSRQHEGLRGEEHQRGIAMMMRKRMLRRVVVIGANVECAVARLDITGERIGEVNMMMRMFDAIHDSDIGLCRQDGTERHAKDGDRASQRNKASAQRRLAFGGPSRRKRWQFSTVQDPGNAREHRLGPAALAFTAKPPRTRIWRPYPSEIRRIGHNRPNEKPDCPYRAYFEGTIYQIEVQGIAIG